MDKINTNASSPAYYYISDSRKILKSTAVKVKQTIKNDIAGVDVSKKEMLKQIKGALKRLGIKADNSNSVNIWTDHVS
ncbi:MAG: hypothetical protein ACUZ8H_12250 [Candidatus Anammoxibacter sp.]